MEGHAKKCVERYCELANKKTEQLYKVSTPCLDGHNFKKEELETVGEMSKVCSRIVLKCMYLSRIGRPVILWSRNKLARAVTKRTRACDKRLARLISYIHHTSDHRQYCHVVMRRIIFGIVPRFGFCWRRGEEFCVFKKQTSVSHSSIESEVISLDAGLRMDGIPALDLCDLVIGVLHSSSNVPARRNLSRDEINVLAPRNPSRYEIQSKHTNTNTKTERHGNRDTDELSDVEHNTFSLRSHALYFRGQ